MEKEIKKKGISITEELMDRFFRGDVTDEENEALASWLDESQANRDRFQRSYNLYVETKYLAAEKAWEDNNKDSLVARRNRRAFRALSWMAGMAASLIVGFVIVQGIRFHRDEHSKADTLTLSTAAGEMATLKFADGSTVHLNSGTTVSYPVRFGKVREVYIDGQALFDVAKNSGRPFIVNTYRYQVKVTGTQFDVYSDEHAGQFSVVLLEGNVTVKDRDSEKSISMKPGQSVQADGNGILVRSETGEDPDQVLWNQGVITFSGKTTFMDVMSTFEKAFGIKVVVEGTKVPSNMPVRMKVYRSAGPDKAFQILQAAGVRFTYRVDPDTGTYYIE